MAAVAAVAAVVSVMAVGLSSYVTAARALTEANESKMFALMESRTSALTDYLATIRQDLNFQSENPFVESALTDFSGAWLALGRDQTNTLQRLYIEDNPHPTGQKENLDFASDGSAYSAVHATYHPWFRSFLRERGYYELYRTNAMVLRKL